MSADRRLLAVIPARGGSKGLPGKNIRPFAGRPLIAHSILCAQMCPEIDRCLVSTDSEEIASVAKQYGAEVPFVRPQELAQDDTPLWQVLRHALAFVEREEGRMYDLILLLDPTSPAREPKDVSMALRRLADMPSADGIVSVSRPDFNPIWNCVVERDGWMTDWADQAKVLERRQDAPVVYRINGALYLWRSAFVRTEARHWRGGRHLLHEIPESRAMSIDSLEAFERTELLVSGGLIHLPWLHMSEHVSQRAGRR